MPALEQVLKGRRILLTGSTGFLGKVFAPNYVNPYPFFDDNRQYLNQMYATSVTIPVPLRGFGAVAGRAVVGLRHLV